MATVDFDVFSTSTFVTGPISEPKPGEKKRFNRIQEVRRRQGVSLRSAARQLGTDVRSVRAQEQSTADLRISELHKWQQALDVPVAELLVESEEALSGPVLERARMVRLMKTAAALLERAPTPAVSRMAQMMAEQLVEIMPELRDVGPWHSVGQRRGSDDFGRVVERRLKEDFAFADSDLGDD